MGLRWTMTRPAAPRHTPPLARFRLVTLQLAFLSGSGVAWNGNSGEVSSYGNQVCGLCGNFMPPAVSIRGANGALVAPATSNTAFGLGTSWAVPPAGQVVADGANGFACIDALTPRSACDAQPAKRAESERLGSAPSSQTHAGGIWRALRASTPCHASRHNQQACSSVVVFERVCRSPAETFRGLCGPLWRVWR